MIVCVGDVHLASRYAQAARLIQRGLEMGKSVIAFPKSLYLLSRLARILPDRLVDKIMAGIEVSVPQTLERNS